MGWWVGFLFGKAVNVLDYRFKYNEKKKTVKALLGGIAKQNFYSCFEKDPTNGIYYSIDFFILIRPIPSWSM